MQSDRSWLPRREMGKLQRGLAAAPDAQIAKVVAMVDALDARGVADDVIAPLRPRLAQMRPRRPLRLCRLLFLPLDPLIVPAAAWQPDHPTIPRTALMPMCEVVVAGLGAEARAIDDMMRGRAVEDNDITHAAGGLLWPAAARILADAALPPSVWHKTSMSPDAWLVLSRPVAGLLSFTDKLHALFAELEIGVVLHTEALIPLVACAAQHGLETLSMLAALVLARAPEARKLLIRAGRVLGQDGEARMRVAATRAIETLLARLDRASGVESLVRSAGLANAGLEVRRIMQLVECVRASQEPSLQARLHELLQRLDAICRRRFGAAIKVEFADLLVQLGNEPEPAAFNLVEDAARGLHDLKQEASRIGNPDAYDALLQQAASLVKAAESQGALSLVDRVRLVEILLGPEEALAILEAEQPDI
jgi:hypothetical protein